MVWQTCDHNLLAFSTAVFGGGRVKCRGDIGAVIVKEVDDLLKTEFIEPKEEEFEYVQSRDGGSQTCRQCREFR